MSWISKTIVLCILVSLLVGVDYLATRGATADALEDPYVKDEAKKHGNSYRSVYFFSHRGGGSAVGGK